jgi:hypothetical protein
MNDDVIRRFLEEYGQALSSGNLARVARCWDVPALVLSEEGALAVSDRGAIERFFAQATAWYQAQGWVSTRPELERVERLSTTLTAVEVRWPTFDAAGTEQFSERSYYLLQADAGGQPRIRVALTRPT